MTYNLDFDFGAIYIYRPQEGIIPLRDGRIGDCSIIELSTRSYNAENVFFESQDPGEQSSNSKREGEMNLSWTNLTCSNVSARPVMACGQETMSDPSPIRLAAPQVLRPNDAPDQGSMEIDFSQSLTEIIATIHGVDKDPQVGINVISNHTDAWMAVMRSRQDNYEEQVKRLQNNLVTLNITMQGAESLYKELQGDVEALKSEVWQRLRTDERRMDKLDRCISAIEDHVKENLETVSEWFADLTARSSPEIQESRKLLMIVLLGLLLTG